MFQGIKGYTPGQNFDPNLCTHYVYYADSGLYFNQITGEIILPSNKSHLPLIKALKSKNPKLKTMVFLPFAIDLNSTEAINQFTNATIRFLKNNLLDGIEFQLEWILPSQIIDFQNVSKAMRSAFDLNNLTLSARIFKRTGNYNF